MADGAWFNLSARVRQRRALPLGNTLVLVEKSEPTPGVLDLSGPVTVNCITVGLAEP
jgi:hypothetical protein